MQYNQKRPVHPLRMAAVLLLLVLISTSIVSGRFARYVSSDSAEHSARIAAYVFDISDTGNHYLDISGIRQPGDSATYHFTVRNHNGSATSEVNEEFILSLELQGSLPLVCTLTRGDSISLNAQNMDATGLVTGTGSVHGFTAAVQSGVEYELTVSWPENETDIRYSRAGLAQLALNVAAQQVD